MIFATAKSIEFLTLCAFSWNKKKSLAARTHGVENFETLNFVFTSTVLRRSFSPFTLYVNQCPT